MASTRSPPDIVYNLMMDHPGTKFAVGEFLSHGDGRDTLPGIKNLKSTTN